jgi:regulatory protein
MKKLSQRSYSSFELNGQLKERLVSQATIDRVIEECVHLGYIDDKAWLEQFVQMQLLRKSGPKMIEAKLYQKGVPKAFYKPVLASHATHEDQKEAIERLIQTRFRSKDLSDFKDRQKVFGALVRKGFDFEVVKEAIEEA